VTSLSLYSEFSRPPLFFPQTLFSHSLRSTICDAGYPNPRRTLRITNGGSERAKKKTVFGGEREERLSKLRIQFFLIIKIDRFTELVHYVGHLR